MRWLRRHDPLGIRIRTYGPLLFKVRRRVERRIRWPVDSDAEWWNIVALQSASAGAAVGVGEYEQSLAEAARRRLPVSSGPPMEGPGHDLAAALRERRSLEAAYRVLLWAYSSELHAELWAPRHRVEMERSRSLVGLHSVYEEAVFEWASSLLTGSGEAVENDLSRFRVRVLDALAAAATGTELREAHPSGGEVEPTWLSCYVRGRQTAASELRRLAPRGVQVSD